MFMSSSPVLDESVALSLDFIGYIVDWSEDFNILTRGYVI